MGFTTAFLSSFTLTSSLLYLTLHAHRESRLSQSLVLKQSSLILTNIVDPLPLPPPTSARMERTGVLETAKDKWNREVENGIKWVYGVDWRAVGERMENGVRGLIRKGREVEGSKS